MSGVVVRMPRSKRSQARVLALQALCAYESGGDAFDAELERFLRDAANYGDLRWAGPPSPEILKLAKDLARGAWHSRARADELLGESVPGWSVQRMSPVDRNILRLGLYELLERPGTPPAVVINEAIELARDFGGSDSPKFVNGVLDGIRRKLDAAGAEEA